MTNDLFVGVIALVLVVLIARRLWRGLSTGTLPLYRTYLKREEDRVKFAALAALHAVSLVLVAGIAADLLLGLGWRQGS